MSAYHCDHKLVFYLNKWTSVRIPFSYQVILIAALFQNIAASYRPWLHYITPVNIESKAYYVAHSIGDTALIHFRISMRLLIFIEVRPIIYQIIYLTLRYSTNTVRDVLSIFNTCRDVMPAASFRPCLLQAVTLICFIWWGLQEQNSLHITTRRLDILCIIKFKFGTQHV